MERLTTIATARSWRAAVRGAIGFVPTMGALHAGHLRLVQRARAGNDHVLVSIFLNPLQFAAGEDLDRYPRDLEGDCGLLSEAGVCAVYLPTAEAMYPLGFSTSVEVQGPLTERLEAAHRPTHFRGVTTVVTKLFQIAGADRSYFGMKDAQQLLVLAKLVRDLAIPTTIVPVATVREADGLALSSRNVYLGPLERAAAAAIPRALAAARARFDGGERDATALRAAVRTVLDEEPALQVQYVSCADLEALAELDAVADVALLSLAAVVGGTHLIDNHWLGLPAGDPPLGALPPALHSAP